MAEPPSVHLRGALSEALAPAVLAALDERTLREWLTARRWFAAKGREPRGVRIAGVIPLAWGGEGDVIARIEVEPGDAGETQHYQLPLAVRAEAAVPADAPVLLRVESEHERAVVIDATLDPSFRRRLGEAFAAGARFGDAHGRWVVEPMDPAGIALDTDAGSRVLSGEQSNTSIVYGDRAILKLFRRLESGINPDVEIGRVLTARAFYPHTPALLGTIMTDWAGGEPAVAGMLQRFLPGSGDAWTFALGRLAEHLDAGGPDFVAEAAELGRITRELHEALASVSDDPDFAPLRATREDVRLWTESARRSADEAVQLLEARLASLAPAVRDEGSRLLGQRVRLLDRIAEAAAIAERDPGMRIRHHGDYHLGQVLRTGDGRFVIIDFEGEPARPLAERRAKHSPLRDAAGMLRSFAYAAAAGAMASADANADARATEWERGARESFLRTYLADTSGTALRPRSRDAVEALISLFELEKGCYELAYELNNRPDWIWIPMRGLGRELADR